ncbi:hypothetical protein B0H17DRAFT_1042970 [Mycena rosella]|uniref:Uncharacterized protein n=1 Tax=Mycena rosella TaxID=1033263 RepID=A0AAD7DZA1_MYCRO|nr:hypothetical protein B0H17DRAFT_1042970 [Mycena rosella]
MLSTPITPTLNAIWMASPPPPFSTSSFISTAFCFFLRHSSGAGRTELQPLPLAADYFKSPVLLRGDTEAIQNRFALSPVLPLDSEGSLRWSTHGDCIKSPADKSRQLYSETEGQAFQSPFHGVGLGLGLAIPQEYVLSARFDSEATTTSVAVESPAVTSATPAAIWGLFEALAAFFDNVHALSTSTESSILSSSSPAYESLTGVLPHLFAPTVLSPMVFRRPNPPTPDPTCPRSLRFKGTPVYRLASPSLPAGTHARARHRPSPRRPRPCTTAVDVKSPVFEYHASTGTTPHDRHGWDPRESAAARARGAKRPSAPHRPASFPASDLPTLPPFAQRADPAPPALPWRRVAVHRAPYTPLPRSPLLPSDVPRSPRPENHFQQTNYFKSEAARRALLKPVFVEPGWVMALQTRDRATRWRTPEQRMASRGRTLAREEAFAEKEREKRRWWREAIANVWSREDA